MRLQARLNDLLRANMHPKGRTWLIDESSVRNDPLAIKGSKTVACGFMDGPLSSITAYSRGCMTRKPFGNRLSDMLVARFPIAK